MKRWIVVALPSAGCSRQLTVSQGKYINTAMHYYRPEDQQKFQAATESAAEGSQGVRENG